MLNLKLKEMNKLESLNSPKYSLTPEKMGELVGGDIIESSTGSGVNSQGKKYSSDTRYDYTGSDIQREGNVLTVAYTRFHYSDEVDSNCGCQK